MAKAIVNTPVEGFNGKVVGVTFVNGTADVDDEAQLAYFERQGYQVIYAPAAAEVEIPEGDPADGWTVPQLKAFAESKSIDLGKAKTKPEILAALAVAVSSTPPSAPDPATAGAPADQAAPDTTE